MKKQHKAQHLIKCFQQWEIKSTSQGYKRCSYRIQEKLKPSLQLFMIKLLHLKIRIKIIIQITSIDV